MDVNSSWYLHATRTGHTPETCNCIGCRRWRGAECPPPPKRVKRARNRGYLWLTDEQDLILRAIAIKQGRSLGECCREAISDFCTKYAEE